MKKQQNKITEVGEGENNNEKLFGIVGYPLEHSLSKAFFEKKFAMENIENVSFENFPIKHIVNWKLFLLMAEMKKTLCGFNVTIPFKEEIMPFLDAVSDIAEEVGAVNVVKIDRNSEKGKFLGYNTDVLGFEKSLLEHKQAKHHSALVFGTGGAAKAVVYVLKKLNIDYQFVSRQSKNNTLTYEVLDKKTIENNLLLINTTPLGMFPNTDTCPPIDYTAIGKDHFLFDLVYNPTETLFLKKGKKQGAKTQNGYDMLCYQAEEAWQIWNE